MDAIVAGPSCPVSASSPGNCCPGPTSSPLGALLFAVHYERLSSRRAGGVYAAAAAATAATAPLEMMFNLLDRQFIHEKCLLMCSAFRPLNLSNLVEKLFRCAIPALFAARAPDGLLLAGRVN